MSTQGPAELNHTPTTGVGKPSERIIRGRTEVYFGPEENCDVAVIEGGYRGETGARIVACVNALDGIDDPLIFVSAATTLLGFAAAHTGSGCRTVGESVAADVTINDPAYLADVVDTMRRCLSGGER